VPELVEEVVEHRVGGVVADLVADPREIRIRHRHVCASPVSVRRGVQVVRTQ